MRAGRTEIDAELRMRMRINDPTVPCFSALYCMSKWTYPPSYLKSKFKLCAFGQEDGYAHFDMQYSAEKMWHSE